MPYVLKKISQKKEQKALFFLVEKFQISQKIAQRWIDKRRVYCNGSIVQKKSQMIYGDIGVYCFEASSHFLSPLFETPFFVIYDKPAQMLIHPRNRQTPYSLMDELRVRYGENANAVHRLDFETSGLVLCAKNHLSERELKGLFEQRKVSKKYTALVRGKIEKSFCVDASLKKKDHGLISIKMEVHNEGKESITYVKPLRYFEHNNTTLVELTPKTGRQHQLRVHMFHVKHPIVGDPIYGQDESWSDKFLSKKIDEEERELQTGSKRLMLHAHYLEFKYNNRFVITSQSRLPI